ncbi:hypothetical protein SU69_05530 [Thermosipho melanesiensis]|uniref:Uncharacterized protein n=2 Tax=Thermosipho melanesiensis TaxID=46541 RepID=A6LLZ3_THEM4|nr:hypothetical protein [Thermosipho melanesiensis]ABR30944.1 hypothetical protein Tmel_1084 [Thermosipho melanesiensis BI429]APT74873.1 hypothetical protein BW47_05795 [Thermosipho melanesiensis]OOC35987.1 hypothetical protein SU68_05590 [Thermosipho melanesiensis]OOC38126.1 hypothetical protein SU69_05530 [Thermosipho melanesiensis]OOC38255.1 hypothetical protein SU70_05540 [Thermosipho melanesiensis]
MSKQFEILEKMIETFEDSIFKKYLLSLRKEEFGISERRDYLRSKYDEIVDFYKAHEKGKKYENKNG